LFVIRFSSGPAGLPVRLRPAPALRSSDGWHWPPGQWWWQHHQCASGSG